MARNIFSVLASRIHEERRKTGLSIEKLAELSSTTPGFISLVESGKRKPTLDTLQRIASALDISMTDLLKGASRERGQNSAYAMQFERLIQGYSPAKKRRVLDVVRAAVKLAR